MATLNYIIKSERKTTFATLWIRLRSGREYDIFVQSGYSIPPELWNNKTQKIRPKFTDIDNFTENSARELTNNLNTLRAIVLNALNDNAGQTINKEWLEKIVHSYHNPIVDVEKSKMTLTKFINKFIEEITNGTRLTADKKRFSHGTIKAYKGFRERYNEFCKFKRKQIDFNDINLDLYNDFVTYFTKKNYSINTIGRHIKELKVIMRVSRDDGYHNNSEIEKRKFHAVTAKVDNIYLTESELAAMYALDLSGKPNWDAARDVFLMGCYTAQRYSDYSIIEEQNIRKLSKGETVIDLKQLKTGSRVIVPARKEVLEILAKYENKLPKTYEQKVNKYIKEVAKLAGITEPVEVEQMENGRLVKKVVPKNELVKTHTARRSGATNMYLAGIPAISIMKITGHKTEREFMKYIKASEEETAIELMNHPYFSGKKKNKK